MEWVAARLEIRQVSIAYGQRSFLVWVDPEWVPVIGEALRWVRDLSSSKRKMRLEIEDLKRQVDTLIEGNTLLLQRNSEIVAAVIAILSADKTIPINRGTTNYHGVSIEQHPGADSDVISGLVESARNSSLRRNADESNESLFEGIDEEILKARAMRPSERRS